MSSCSSVSNVFRQTEKIPFQVLNSIKNTEKWEHILLKHLFKDFEIQEVNDNIILTKRFKQYSALINTKVTNSLTVFITTSNELDLNILANDLSKNENFRVSSAVTKETIDKYTRETNVNFLFHRILDKKEFEKQLFDILGDPIEVEKNQYKWNINDYRIVYRTIHNTIRIELKYNLY